ncbi:MAG: replication initiator protein A [Butyrivibrio sp.]|nr:replication initiator protein A [Butyrivibrio sp.]MBP3277937.1 replication initiator protein A [Butyrivibrio sp.]
MMFDYFYKEQSESYTFYKIPKVLFTEEPFQKMSTDARVLYGLLLERTSLSRENGWFDENGRIFVYYTIKAVKASMGCANDKAVGLLKELERIGLIEKRKQGLCKPTIIYVKDFMGFRKTERRNSDNQNSGVPKIRILDDRKAESNNTENNNTDFNKTNLILSGLDVDKDERSVYHDILMEQLSMDILYERYPFDRDTLDAILDMMLDIICSKKKDILIAGDRRPLNVVKSQFLKLNSMHIEYVMDCLKSNPVKVRNIKQYLLAALYNAPLTINSYYQAMVNNDMAEGRI